MFTSIEPIPSRQSPTPLKRLMLLPLTVLIGVFFIHYFYQHYILSVYTFSYMREITSAERFLFPLLLSSCFYWISMRVLKKITVYLQATILIKQHPVISILIPLFANVIKVILLLTSFNIMAPYLNLPPSIALSLEKLSSILIIGAIAWLLIKATDIVEQLILRRYKDETAGDLTARKMYTQIIILKRVAIGVISILATGGILMMFENIRALGASVLTTAGVIGLVFTFAAQRSLANVFSGLEIAVTQPIKIGDAIIIENEYGTVEEINFRSVTIKLWDWRRLIVPINYFLEKPFQNWSREQSTNLIGTIYLYVDYTLPLDELRAELKKILNASALWDKKVSTVQVSDVKTNAMELRILCSAQSPADAWDLRCEVREKLINFIVKNYPMSLPMNRAKQCKEDLESYLRCNEFREEHVS